MCGSELFFNGFMHYLPFAVVHCSKIIIHTSPGFLLLMFRNCSTQRWIASKTNGLFALQCFAHTQNFQMKQ